MEFNDLETLKADLCYIQKYACAVLSLLEAKNSVNDETVQYIRQAMNEIRFAYLSY